MASRCTWGEGNSGQVDWDRFAALAGDRTRLANDPAGYGRELYALVFADAAVEGLGSGTRLLLVSDNEQISAASWEDLRDGTDRLVAGWLSLVHGLPAGAARGDTTYSLPATQVRGRRIWYDGTTVGAVQSFADGYRHR